MPLTLTPLHGQALGDLTITPARGPVLIGRSPMCGIVIDDGYVSDTHAAVAYDGARALLRDLGSHTGTWVNGAGIQQTEHALQSGDRVQIGQTMLSVTLVDDVSAAPTPDALAALVASRATTARDCARFALRAERTPLFALVELADDPELLELLNESGEMFCALDESVEVDALGDAAPCLVAFSRGSPLLGALMEHTWGNGQAVFFTSDAPFSDVYAHWLSRVEYDDEGAVMGAHFWVPEVLGELLAGLTGDDVGSFFGPVRAFLAEGDDEATMLRWTALDGRAQSEPITLTMSS